MGKSRENAPKTPTKTKLTTKRREAKAKTCFCQRSSSDSAICSGSENREEAREEELCHHAGAAASLGPSPSSSRGCDGARDAESGLLPLHMPGLLHQAGKTESLCKGKHFILDSPREGWIQRTCSSAFLNQGWALVVPKSQQVFACLCWEGKPQISPEQASWSV